jgi:carbon-monoxide dehydrogenase large subunit
MADGSIGTPVRRREDYRFLTGQGTYTDDINRPGQLYAYILRSPHANARLEPHRYASGAASAPGVVAVFNRPGHGQGRRSAACLCGWLINLKDAGSPMKSRRTRCWRSTMCAMSATRSRS